MLPAGLFSKTNYGSLVRRKGVYSNRSWQVREPVMSQPKSYPMCHRGTTDPGTIGSHISGFLALDTHLLALDSLSSDSHCIVQGHMSLGNNKTLRFFRKSEVFASTFKFFGIFIDGGLHALLSVAITHSSAPHWISENKGISKYRAILLISLISAAKP